MTANVTFEIQRSSKDALTVPATALRLQTTPDLIETPATPEQPDGKPRDAVVSGGPPAEKPSNGAASGRGAKGGARKSRAVVYVQTPTGRLRAVPVRTGITDGVRTVVELDDAAALAEGADVVTAVIRDEPPATTNPFAPPRMGGTTRPAGQR